MHNRITGRLMTALLLGAFTGLAADRPAVTTLKVEIDNYVSYFYDGTEYSKLASDPNRTTPVAGRTFGTFVQIGDIVAVNGAPAKGTWVTGVTNLGLTPMARPGGPFPNSAIADTIRQNVADMYFEILKSDGTPVGTIMAFGPTRGTPPPGAPSVQTGDNIAVIGGTGAFLGARGQAGVIEIASTRNASVAEDPANRRLNGGARRSYVISLVPMSHPEIVAIVHATDYKPVTGENPARPGETLTAYAWGLGPTRGGSETEDPSPGSPALVNSPVDVTVNGVPGLVLYAGSYSAALDAYQINFTLPEELKPGIASVELKTAWIASPPFSLAIR